MNSIYLAQSNVDSLPPPNPDVEVSTKFPANQSSQLSLPSRSSSPNEPAIPVPRKLPAARVTEGIGSSLAETLRSRWKSYRERLDECRHDPTPESIHELRVAIRRLISQFVLLTQVLPGCGAEKARNLLKRQLESLGPLRDTHVQQMFIQRHLARFPDLAGLLNRLKRDERLLVRRASHNIRQLKTNKLEKWIGSLVKVLHQQSLNRRAEFASFVLRCADAAFGVVAERWRTIDRADLRTVHRTRVAFKKFRYIVESLPPELTHFGKSVLRQLARYQRRMGHIQDLEVILQCVRGFRKHHDLPGLEPFCRYLRNRTTRVARSFLKTSNRLLQFWPPPEEPAIVRRGARDANRSW